MPDPVTANPWSANPWATDVDREAAADTQRAGSPYRWAAAQGIRETEVVTPPGQEDSSDVQSFVDAYQSLVADWPDVSPLISRHITRQDRDEVQKYWDEHWRNPNKLDDILQCFDWAEYQMREAGYRGTGTGSDPATYFQLFVESADDTGARVDVTDTDTTMQALAYVKDRVTHGVPVMVGIRLLGYHKRPNPDNTTNHFVVIVGMGRDEAVTSLDPEFYFEYFDYLIEDPLRFYLYNVPTLALGGYNLDPRVAQVRRSARL